jgi:hypothetical protein
MKKKNPKQVLSCQLSETLWDLLLSRLFPSPPSVLCLSQVVAGILRGDLVLLPVSLKKRKLLEVFDEGVPTRRHRTQQSLATELVPRLSPRWEGLSPASHALLGRFVLAPNFSSALPLLCIGALVVMPSDGGPPQALSVGDGEDAFALFLSLSMKCHDNPTLPRNVPFVPLSMVVPAADQTWPDLRKLMWAAAMLLDDEPPAGHSKEDEREGDDGGLGELGGVVHNDEGEEDGDWEGEVSGEAGGDFDSDEDPIQEEGEDEEDEEGENGDDSSDQNYVPEPDPPAGAPKKPKKKAVNSPQQTAVAGIQWLDEYFGNDEERLDLFVRKVLSQPSGPIVFPFPDKDPLATMDLCDREEWLKIYPALSSLPNVLAKLCDPSCGTHLEILHEAKLLHVLPNHDIMFQSPGGARMFFMRRAATDHEIYEMSMLQCFASLIHLLLPSPLRPRGWEVVALGMHEIMSWLREFAVVSHLSEVACAALRSLMVGFSFMEFRFISWVKSLGGGADIAHQLEMAERFDAAWAD